MLISTVNRSIVGSLSSCGFETLSQVTFVNGAEIAGRSTLVVIAIGSFFSCYIRSFVYLVNFLGRMQCLRNNKTSTTSASP